MHVSVHIDLPVFREIVIILELVVPSSPSSNKMLPAAGVEGVKLFLPDKRSSSSSLINKRS